ncbi:hypothetical protein GCM10023149_52240 [Mucilaginibacter gynuensis]|uniref:Uncharacterized protein n=1 Tax=Mucilaginibacter gynuensis TaxID=1302236 RepID=A0ABP8HKI4_9SPHI
MKKLFSLALLLLSTISFSFAQQNNAAANLNFKDLSQLQYLPKATRDSLKIVLKKANKAFSAPVNGKNAITPVPASGAKFFKAMSELMIQILDNPDPALIAKNQAKCDRLQADMEFDLQMVAEKMTYEQERKSIIDEYKSGDYDDAEERRDARKEMNEDLKDLKEDYDDTIKEFREERKERLQELAEQEKDA